MTTFWFDMDGTIADLYAVSGWLEALRAFSPMPYREAKPLCSMSRLARMLNRVQREGYHIGIISWASKVSNPAFDKAVAEAKKEWLHKHLPSVCWDAIEVVPYGTPKAQVCGSGILFDDEERNRMDWMNEQAYTPEQIFEVLSRA